MVDLHHHLLHGVDDGAPDLATAVAMAKMSADDGVTHVVCTPHANGRYAFETVRLQMKLSELRSALAGEAVPIEIGWGCDFRLSNDNLGELLRNRHKYTINGKSVLLIELPEFGLSLTLNNIFRQILSAGFVPVITHPERNLTLSRDLPRIREWVELGVLTQITAGSLLGAMGSRAKRIAHAIVADGLAHFVATDAHNLTSRPPRMRDARNLLKRMYGEPCAQRLCNSNPMAAFAGRADSDFYRLQSASCFRRKRWWKLF